MQKTEFKLRLKRIGWTLTDFNNYININKSTLKDEITNKAYIRVLELLEHDKIKALELKNNLLEELEKEKTKSD